ncbi:hypothetical protein H072_6952 [Dactylellina haptotyla CBS 200.50]|uniref:Uncharacterized protein n=1 Tax=Dactylellina haptotyla (strain CBS 200.50) TaxID=1284197 RepID=S8A8U2_DACHA|nr:hypothetical protein H072_6952 [Dactylellina haptotyla CBS 200.50]
MGIPLWESPPDAKTLDKASATNRCDVHSTVHTSSGTSTTRLPSTPGPSSTGRGSGSLAYDYIYSGSRPIRRHLLDSSADTIEIEDLQNEREHETQIRERERERDLSARMERSRRERGERRSAHMERFLNANYHTPQLPTTSTTSQRPRPHMIQPSSDQLLTLSEFLRESPSSQNRTSNAAQPPTSDGSTIQQIIGIRGSSGNRGSGERRDIQAWERALSAAAGIPPSLTPATTAVSTSNAAATISNPPPVPRRSTSIPTEWPPASPVRSTSPSTTRTQDSFQALVNQIRRIGALQDYMLNSVDETAASLEESLSIHSQALNQALNTQPQSSSNTTSSATANPPPLSGFPDINSQNYYTSLRVREARIRTMQSRIDLLASEFALLRSTRRELRRAENEAINMFQSAGVLPPTSTSTSTTPTIAGISVANTNAIDIPTNTSPTATTSTPALPLPPPPGTISIVQDTLRTEVDEVDEALDAEGNSSRRVLRSTFLPAELGDEALFRHFENAENRARVRERLAGVRRELEEEQRRSTEILRLERRRMAEVLAEVPMGDSGEDDEDDGDMPRRRGYQIANDRGQNRRA